MYEACSLKDSIELKLKSRLEDLQRVCCIIEWESGQSRPLSGKKPPPKLTNQQRAVTCSTLVFHIWTIPADSQYSNTGTLVLLRCHMFGPFVSNSSIKSSCTCQPRDERTRQKMIPAAPACLPWHAAYPAPRAVASSVSRLDLLGWMKEGKKVGKDYVLIDLRRTDFEV